MQTAINCDNFWLQSFGTHNRSLANRKFMCYCTFFALIYFEFEGNFQVQASGAYIWRGDLMEGFLFYEFGGLKFGGACRWRGLFSEFYSKIWSCVQISPSNNAWLPYVCQMCIFPVFDYAGSISFRTVSSLRKNTILCKKETRVRWFSKTEIFTNRVWLLRLIFSNQILETTNCWLIGFLLVSTLKAEASFSLCELSYEK